MINDVKARTNGDFSTFGSCSCTGVSELIYIIFAIPAPTFFLTSYIFFSIVTLCYSAITEALVSRGSMTDYLLILDLARVEDSCVSKPIEVFALSDGICLDFERFFV